MPPPLSARMAAALRRHQALALLAEIEHPSRTGRFWTGAGPLSWNGVTWTGSGTLGTVTPIKRTSDLMIQELTFTLAGVDPNVAAGLDDNIRNLGGRVWLACLNSNGQVVPNPYQIVDAELDFQSLSASENGTVTIAITARSGFYTLERGIDEVWTTEQQKIDYPGDSGLDLISGLQNQDIQWTPS